MEDKEYTRRYQLAFSVLDSDSDGFISFKELENICTALELDVTQSDLVDMVAAAHELCGTKIPKKKITSSDSKSFTKKFGYEEDDIKMDWNLFYKMVNAPLTQQDLKTMWTMLRPKRTKGKENVPVGDLCSMLEVLSGSSEKWSDQDLSDMLSDAGAKGQMNNSIQFTHFKKMWEGTDESRERYEKKQEEEEEQQQKIEKAKRKEKGEKKGEKKKKDKEEKKKDKEEKKKDKEEKKDEKKKDKEEKKKDKEEKKQQEKDKESEESDDKESKEKSNNNGEEKVTNVDNTKKTKKKTKKEK